MSTATKEKFMAILEEFPELIFDIFQEFIQYASEQYLSEFLAHLNQYEILFALEREEYIDETIDEE